MSKRRYGQWAGNENGNPENVNNCIKEVYPVGGWIPRQCHRKRGFGPKDLYCKQHAKQLQEKPGKDV